MERLVTLNISYLYFFKCTENNNYNKCYNYRSKYKSKELYHGIEVLGPRSSRTG